ncbi:hypothetical protein, partial [Niastella populi]|uniref:hypothetical protein n=1 Tax=Niastella populi TaxID=550983 RepID=UPI0013FE3F9E
RVTFSLEYAVDIKEWDSRKEMLDNGDVQYFTLRALKDRLNNKYHLLKTEGKVNVLTLLKNEAESLMNGNGLEGIARSLFDIENKEKGVPSYDEFIKAFEKYSGLKKGEYKIQTLDELIHFHTEGEVYEMDTYQGLHARLKGYIERKSYEEIYIQTKSWIWRDIYLDAGIKKHKFMPHIWANWESYWITKYQDILELVGKTSHLDEMKASSWRALQVFMECYNDAGDIITLAYEIDDDMRLYPLSVITMLEIFDAETCFDEYCEYEFDQSDEWESVSISDDDDSPIFYIKPEDL